LKGLGRSGKIREDCLRLPAGKTKTATEVDVEKGISTGWRGGNPWACLSASTRLTPGKFFLHKRKAGAEDQKDRARNAIRRKEKVTKARWKKGKGCKGRGSSKGRGGSKKWFWTKGKGEDFCAQKRRGRISAGGVSHLIRFPVGDLNGWGKLYLTV